MNNAQEDQEERLEEHQNASTNDLTNPSDMFCIIKA